jgi:hypothetical protein
MEPGIRLSFVKTSKFGGGLNPPKPPLYATGPQIHIYVCMCVCIYIHTYIHAYKHTYIHKNKLKMQIYWVKTQLQ